MDEVEKTGKILTFRNEIGAPVPAPEEVVHDGFQAYRAYKSHQGGSTWVEVAHEQGYPSAMAARYDVRRWLTEAQALVSDWSRREMLTLKVAQLEELRKAVWDKAIGDPSDPENKGPHLPSAIFARDLIMSEAKLLRLDETVDGEEEQNGPRTVVIASEDYAKALAGVIEGD